MEILLRGEKLRGRVDRGAWWWGGFIGILSKESTVHIRIMLSLRASWIWDTKGE